MLVCHILTEKRMTKFIVLSGKKQAGKTVSAQFLKEDLQGRIGGGGYSVHITSFAAPIKDFIGVHIA